MSGNENEPIKFEELKNMTRSQIINKINDTVGRFSVANQFMLANYYLGEIERRNREENDRKILKYTNQMRWLTVGIGIMTLINILIFILK